GMDSSGMDINRNLAERNDVHAKGNGASDSLPPPPPCHPSNVVPLKKKAQRVPIARRRLGTRGQKIQLLTNHSKLMGTMLWVISSTIVSPCYKDGRPVDGKGVGRKVIDRVQETYESELAGKDIAYDGGKSLTTVGPLPQNKHEFTVPVRSYHLLIIFRNAGNDSSHGDGSPNWNDGKRMCCPYQSKTFKAEISFAAKVPIQAISSALYGQESENSQEAPRVLDIVLRQHAAKRGCQLVRQSFFHNDTKNFADVGGSVIGCRGFHSNFRTTQGGLSLNIDNILYSLLHYVSYIVALILLVTLMCRCVHYNDCTTWSSGRFFVNCSPECKRFLHSGPDKGSSIFDCCFASRSNQEYKITGLSEKICKEQIDCVSLLCQSSPDRVAVFWDLPCINVRKPKHPTYIPLELCSLVSLQRYTKALNTFHRASLGSQDKSPRRVKLLGNALKGNNYDADSMLGACGIQISTQFTQIEGCVLPAPQLKFGNVEEFNARNGWRNLNNKVLFVMFTCTLLLISHRFLYILQKLVDPTKIDCWAVFNFSAHCDIHAHFMELRSSLSDFFQKEKTVIYMNLADFGMVTQCMAPTRVNDQLLTNMLMKINAKISVVSKVPTIVLGMDVSHGSPGQSDMPSIAA
ncbi:LOW QUALITY PROTEIN: Argonaute linker 2 domain, partial [Dillenia turbinata]